MSLKGVGKALYRTPHQLFGHKSNEDLIYKQWESDIKTSIAGLEYLKSENIKLTKFWISMVTKFLMVIDIFRDLHCNLDKKNKQDKLVDNNEEFTNITMHELEEASKLAKLLLDKITTLSNKSSDSFTQKSNDMIKILKNVEKLLVKRDHKKIDYDIQTKKLESVLKVQNATEKDMSKIEATEKKLSEAELIYQDFNNKVKLIIPEILLNLSEFMSKITFKLYSDNSDILNYIQRNLSKFSRIHGIVNDSTVLTYEQIINEFNTAYSQGESKLLELTLMKDFRSLREKTLKDRTVKHVNSTAGSVVDSTVNFTSTVYTKASKPNQRLSMSLSSFKIDNPVKPYDKAGIFSTSLDPIEFIKSADEAIELSELNKENITIDQSLSDSEFENNSLYSHSQSIHPSSKTSTHVNTDWMKPLKNSTIKSPPLSSTTDNSDSMTINSNDTTNDTTQESIIHDKSPKSRVSSINIDSNSKTYKYVNISVDEITKQIYMMVTTPEIDKAPLITTKGKIKTFDNDIKEYVSARSSITANAFAAYFNV